MNWFLKLIFDSVSQVIEGIVEIFTDYMNNIFQTMYDLNNSFLNLDKLNNFISGLAIILVTTFAIKQGIQVYALNSDGDPDADPLELLERISVSVAVIMCGNWMVNELIKLSAKIAEDTTSLTTNITNSKSFTSIISAFLKLLVGSPTIIPLVLLGILGAIIISFFLFLYQAGKRGVELTLFQILLPLYALDLLTTNKERWNAFFTDLMITSFGYIVQLICFKIFMLIFAGIAKVSAPKDALNSLLLSFAWMMLVVSAPKWLQKFSYSSGVGSGAKGGLRSATYLVPNLIRK